MNGKEKLEEPKVKVTDKRMFGPDGQLREEYRFLEESETSAAARGASRQPAAEGESEPPPRREPVEPEGRPLEIPTGVGGPGSPSFLDLLSILAEPVAIYLGDVKLPDGSSAENLDVARLHIDLLDVLRQKTAGNLTAQEASVLEDLLYRLRMRYVQKRG